MRKRRPQHELEETICQYIKEPPLALYDIGVGNKTEWRTLLKRYPNMHVYGCEPHPQLFRKLTRIFPGGLVRVAIGMGDKAKLYLRKGSTNIGSTTVFPLDETEEVDEVNVWSLDQFDRWAGRWERILLWMDIEGSELNALKSGPALLESRRVNWINLEVRDESPCEGWCTAKEIDEFLTLYGYKKVLEYNDQKTHRDVIYVLGE